MLNISYTCEHAKYVSGVSPRDVATLVTFSVAPFSFESSGIAETSSSLESNMVVGRSIRGDTGDEGVDVSLVNMVVGRSIRGDTGDEGVDVSLVN